MGDEIFTFREAIANAQIHPPKERPEMETKPTNPKDAIGSHKAPTSTLPWPPVMEAGVVMLHGAAKYGRHNYRETGVRASVYFDAAIRHLSQWWEGEDDDAESGLSHLAHATACLLVVRDAQTRGKLSDDRPPGTSGFVETLNRKAREIVEGESAPRAPILASGPPTLYAIETPV